jgi:hypothetical protein
MIYTHVLNRGGRGVAQSAGLVKRFASHSSTFSPIAPNSLHPLVRDRPLPYPNQHWFSRRQRHTMNEFYVKQLVSDGCASPKENRAHFMPIVPAPFTQGKFMTVLER